MHAIRFDMVAGEVNCLIYFVWWGLNRWQGSMSVVLDLALKYYYINRSTVRGAPATSVRSARFRSGSEK